MPRRLRAQGHQVRSTSTTKTSLYMGRQRRAAPRRDKIKIDAEKAICASARRVRIRRGCACARLVETTMGGVERIFVELSALSRRRLKRGRQLRAPASPP